MIESIGSFRRGGHAIFFVGRFHFSCNLKPSRFSGLSIDSARISRGMSGGSHKHPELPRAQKKWLADAAANHLSDQPGSGSPRPQAEPYATLRGERAAAAAASGGVGILEDEPLAHQRFFVLENRTIEIEQTLWIHEDAGPVLFKNLVAIASLGVQAHGVGQARAASALNAHTQAALFGRDAIFFEQRADFLGGTLGEMNRGSIRADRFCCHN